VTLATEASTSGLSAAQTTALDTEFTSINNEINQIGAATNFNGTSVFGTNAGVANKVDVSISDGVAAGTTNAVITTNIPSLISNVATASGGLGILKGLNSAAPNQTADAQLALGQVMNAINIVAAARGDIGASINRLNAASSDAANTVQNLQSAENGVVNADIGKTVANMTQYNVLQSTGMAALQQSNQAQQAVLKLVQ
jgi:flagellin